MNEREGTQESNSPPVDYRRIAELAEEFLALWNRLQALYLDSVVGFHYITDHIREEQAKARFLVSGSEMDSEPSQDKRLFSYRGILPPGETWLRRSRKRVFAATNSEHESAGLQLFGCSWLSPPLIR